MATLYRQYRPQTFKEIVGQPHVVAALGQAVVKKRLSHAYLFHGPRGTGKTTTARILAKRLNCLKPKGAEPCTKCRLCQASQTGRNTDVVEIDAASNRGIDDIRALRDSATLAPSMSTYKVYIIDEVHMLTGEAFAALLKTLEEPHDNIVFVLATTELHKVPATILSRCQVYRFRRATDEELKKRLQHILKQEKRQADGGALDFIIGRSDGCYRDAESLLGQMLTLQDKKITRDDLTEFLGLPPPQVTEDFLAALVKGDANMALQALTAAFSAGSDPEQLLQECIRASRDAAVTLAIGQGSLPVFALSQNAGQRLPTIIRALLQALQDLAYVPQPLIAIQLAVLTVCQAQTKNRPPTLTSATKIAAKSKPAPAARVAAPAPAAPSGKLPLATVKAAWGDLIQAVRKTNPVASTFLRATEPIEVNGLTITLRVQYALHRNYFDKPANKKLVEETLYNLLKKSVEIRCRLDNGETGKLSETATKLRQAGEDLYQTVKEVFGST